jgi:hypothetical protein
MWYVPDCPTRSNHVGGACARFQKTYHIVPLTEGVRLLKGSFSCLWGFDQATRRTLILADSAIKTNHCFFEIKPKVAFHFFDLSCKDKGQAIFSFLERRLINLIFKVRIQGADSSKSVLFFLGRVLFFFLFFGRVM